MNRRTLLTTAALAATGLAGCSSTDSGDDKAGGQPTKTVSNAKSAERRLAFGETLSLSRIAVTVSRPEATKAYRWTDGDGERTVEAGEGKQWIVVRTRAENTTDRTVRLPLTLNFKGSVGDRLFHPGRNKSVADKYIGGKVPAGEVRAGDVMYLTGSDVSAESFRILYEERRTGGKHRVWWQS